MNLCVASCWFQGTRACLQNFSFSSGKPKLSPLGHTARKENVPAGGTVDQAVQGMCPCREEPHHMKHVELNSCPSAGPMLLVSVSPHFAKPPAIAENKV